jgi:hypothetical protein
LKERDEAVHHASELQKKLDNALLENHKLHTFIEEMARKLMKGPPK